MSDPKEAWNPDRFVEIYNAIALREGGYSFDRSNLEAVERSHALTSPPTLKEFAEAVFTWEQRT